MQLNVVDSTPVPSRHRWRHRPTKAATKKIEIWKKRWKNSKICI